MEIPEIDEYKFGFHDDVVPILSTGKGLREKIVREISEAKNEPSWMLEFRLEALKNFHKLPFPNWGPDLSELFF